MRARENKYKQDIDIYFILHQFKKFFIFSIIYKSLFYYVFYVFSQIQIRFAAEFAFYKETNLLRKGRKIFN